MSNEQPPAVYTVEQAAKRLGISVRAMRGLIARYEIRCYDVSLRPGQGRARWRIDEQAIRDFQEKRSNKPADQPARRRTVRRASKTYV